MVINVRWTIIHGRHYLLSSQGRTLAFIDRNEKDKYRISYDSAGPTNELYDTLREAQDAAELFWGAH